MDLNTAEKFLLIALHPDKSRYLIPEHRLNSGLLGSIFFDLTMEGKIEIKDKRIVSRSPYTNISKAHNLILGRIATSKRNKRIKTWISNIAWNSQKYRHIILHDLVFKGLVRLEERRFLIIPYKRAYVINSKLRTSLIEDLRDDILENRSVDNKTASILGIIDACKMQKILSPDKGTHKIMKTNLKEMVKKDAVAMEVRTVIEEMQAVVVATAISTTS
jgi:hypothetical protein